MKDDRGFTLIEVLVVVIIIGVVLGVASVNFFRDEKQSLADEALRLALLLEHARDQAMLTGKSLAWSAGEGKYEFLQLNSEGKWVATADDETLRPRTFALPITWREFRINGIPTKLGDPLVFSSAGLNPPFDLTLELSGHVLSVHGDPLGRVAVANDSPT